MRFVGDNIAVLDNPNDQLSRWIEESRTLCHDGGVALHYLPHIDSGDVVVDAGAALGDHTVAYVHKTGNPALVHAFECNARMLECLSHNCPRVQIYPYALADKAGFAYITPNLENVGAGYVGETGTEMVATITLDSVGLEKCDFIKWDIEGYETRAINGAKETILRCRPKMIVEISDSHQKRAGSSMSELEALIGSLGYSIDVLIGNREDGQYEALCIPK
jgi:FkbM family methyltransferase